MTAVYFCPRCRGAKGGAAGSKESKRKAAKARWRAARRLKPKGGDSRKAPGES
jgi:hypothetical protein